MTNILAPHGRFSKADFDAVEEDDQNVVNFHAAETCKAVGCVGNCGIIRGS